MRVKALLIPALLVLLALAACAHRSPWAARAQTPALELSRYNFDPETPLTERVTDPPGFVLDYLREMDGRPDYAPHRLGDDEKMLVRRYMERLPQGYRKILQERMLGLYFVDNFLGSGFTEFVSDGRGPVYSFMVMNPKVLNTKLSDWLSEKVRTAFSPDTDRVEIAVDCGTYAPALAWVLLHEATHAADYAESFTPYVEPALWDLQGKPDRKSPFTQGIWKAYALPAADTGWPYAGKVRFYGLGKGPELPLSRAPEVYAALGKTPFASLYATQNWAEDLAEQMAFFHLTQSLGVPYTIRVKKDGKTVVALSPFADENGPCMKREMPRELL